MVARRTPAMTAWLGRHDGHRLGVRRWSSKEKRSSAAPVDRSDSWGSLVMGLSECR